MQVTMCELADYASTTNTGNLNVLGIFTSIMAAKLPARHPSMVLVLRVEGTAAEAERHHTIELHLMDPDGESVARMKNEFPPHHTPQAFSANHIIQIQDAQLAKYGGYTVSVFVNDDLKATRSFEVTQSTSQ